MLSAVNSITPHMSGAVDIMVVEQPDGTFKSTPFYGMPCFPRCQPSASVMSSILSMNINLRYGNSV